jgi:hypothetical protein
MADIIHLHVKGNRQRIQLSGDQTPEQTIQSLTSLTVRLIVTLHDKLECDTQFAQALQHISELRDRETLAGHCYLLGTSMEAVNCSMANFITSHHALLVGILESQQARTA